MGCRKPVLTFQDVYAHPRAFSNQTRVGLLDGTVEKQHILAIIGPDKSGADRPVEPPHGTV
jgi:hypothetical protein